MTGTRTIAIWAPLLIAAVVVSFVLGRMNRTPPSEPTLSGLPDSAQLRESDDAASPDGGELLGESTVGVVPEESDSAPLSSERIPIEAGQTWNFEDLLALNDAAAILFAGNSMVSASPPGAPVAKQFVFPDGERLAVQFNSPPDIGASTAWDDGVSPGFFEPLRDAAEDGDGFVALHLHQSLKHCSTGPRTAAEYAEMHGNLPQQSYAGREESVVRLDEHYRRCRGTTDAMLETSLELLRRSGEAGNPHAAVAWALEIEQAQPAIAEQTFAQAWEEHGSVAAIGEMARIYGTRPHSSYTDEVLAFAYQYASLVITLADVDGLGGLQDEGLRRLREGLINEMRRLEYAGSHSVAEDGKALAYRLIAQNPNCCV